MDTVLLAQAVINPNETIGILRGIAIGIASLILIVIGVAALWGNARKGNSGGVMRVLLAALLALIPIFLGVTLGAVAFGGAVLEFLFPSLTP